MPLDLSFQEIEELLERIINNASLVGIGDGSDKRFVVLSYPSSEHILKMRHIRSCALLEAEREGLPSEEEVREIIVSRNIMSLEDRERIKELEDKLVAQRRILQITKIEGRRKPIIEIIERLQNEIADIAAKSNYYLAMSREYRAEEEATFYLTWASTYNIDGEKWWPTFEDFKRELDSWFRNTVRDEVLRLNRGLSAEQIRYLARNTLWRIRYTAALKLGGSLFSRDLNDLTPDQLSLLYWSNYYQSIHDMLPDDKPSDEIINNDEELDKFMEDYFKRLEAERNDNRFKRRSDRRGRLSVSDKEEVIITQSHPEYLHMSYSENRVQTSDGVAEVSVADPNRLRPRSRRINR